MHVANFRKSSLYQNSLELFHEVYLTTEENGDKLTEIEIKQLRERVIKNTTKITTGIIQQNIKMKFRYFNHAKKEIEKLMEEAFTLYQQGKISDSDGQIIEYYSIQILKLLNYYFGKNKRDG
ncbi:hypothetical protein [Alkalihalobacterium bogoriense]|uniref:hypothetical protein n=1 Tax=Alkalihalobacterium bogoriense TaxID=246272 RepID=UPI0004792D7B|nr:hypothetical protein [Alkalihalobacterium bogoriense]